MTLSEMRAAVYESVKASDVSTEEVTAKLNEALLWTADEVAIPELKRFDVVSTVAGQPYAQLTGLPGGFGGRLLKVGCAAIYPKIQQYAKLEEFVDRYGMLDKVGSVEAVCLDGGVLWYANVPVNPVPLPIVYLRLPESLVDEDDTVDYIPGHLHRLCLAYKAAELIWNGIEDGIEGAKVNTDNYRTLAEVGITKLREHIARTSKHHISSMWRF